MKKLYWIIPGLVVVLIAIVTAEILYEIDKEVIVVTSSSILILFGYFITHILEFERKKYEMKIKFYHEFTLGLKVISMSGERKLQYLEEFENAMYSSWIFASTKVIKFRNEYFDLYSKWTGDKGKYQKELESKEQDLMKAIRQECVDDHEVEFKAFFYTN